MTQYMISTENLKKKLRYAEANKFTMIKVDYVLVDITRIKENESK